MGKEARSNLNTVGVSASSGRRPRMRSTRVRISSAASSRSVPQVKATRTDDCPSDEVEVIVSTPAMAATASSIGRVTRSSTSWGPTFG